MAFFVGHLRNILLNHLDTSGKLVGHYALALLFFQMVAIIVNFGGNGVASNFLPKINKQEDKARFISGYGILQLIILIGLMLILGLREDWFVTLAGEESAEAHGLFLLLVPCNKVIFSFGAKKICLPCKQHSKNSLMDRGLSKIGCSH